MGYPKQVYDRAWEQLSRRREDARARTRARREEIKAHIPELDSLERQMAACAAGVARAIVTSPGRAEELTKQLAKESLALQERRRSLLLERGYPADYLEERYACADCRDSGYRGTQMCSCLRSLLRQEAAAQLSSVSQSANCRFDNFSLEYYPQAPVESSGIVPRERMREILEACRRYAADFTPRSGSMLLLGHTGLGKTHLSLAIARAVTEAGYGVVYTPVQRLLDILESEKFSRGADAREQYTESVRFALSCDLLILDDLGTEFATQFSASALYNIINSRLVEERPTIISTNLELPAIEERYSQRMVSRLVCGYQVLKFYGKDIRYIKKTKRI